MGEVYRAEDIKLKRTVALKRLAPHLQANSLYRQRFQKEAERASRFNDVHMAAIHDVVEVRGEMFLVMEFVEGETLRRRLERPMSLAEFFQVAIQCAQALAHAHQRGIVHCDIKPENIMLTRDGQVKILDFGVAKHLPRSDQSTTAERGGSMVGTPAYMAPEVLLESTPDGRADIFSLGVVLYEALSRYHPFLASSFLATADRIRQEMPPPLERINPNVPAALDCVIRKAMAKDPGRRQASAEELLSELRAVQDGLSPTGLRQLLPRAVRLRRWRWIGAPLIACLVLAGVLAAYYRAHSMPILSERGWVLITDFDNRTSNHSLDEAVREGLSIALEQSHYVNVFPHARALEVLTRMERNGTTRIDEALGREICRREGLQVLLAGTIEQMGHAFQISVRAINPHTGSLLIAEKANLEREDEFFDQTDKLAQRVRKDLGESLAGIEKASRPLAKVTTRSVEALQLYSQAEDAFRSGPSEQVLGLLDSAVKLDADFAMAHLLLAQYYMALVGKNQQALSELEKAYTLRHNVTDREQRRIEANYYDYQERYDQAVQSLGVLLNLYPDDIDAHQQLAEAYDGAGQPEKGISELRELVRLIPSSPQAQGFLVLELAFANDDAGAMAAFQAAERRGVDSPRLHWGSGMAWFGQGKLAEARDEFRRVRSSGKDFEDVGDLLLSRVDCYEGKFSSARAALESGLNQEQVSLGKGLQLARRALLGDMALFLSEEARAAEQAARILASPQSDLQTVDYARAGTLYAASGRIAQARQVLKRLDQIRSSAPSSWNTTNYELVAGEIALAQGKARDAIPRFRAAAVEFPGARAHGGLARSYQLEQEWQLAASEWQEVLKARGDILQEWFPGLIAEAHFERARALAHLGNDSAAAQEYREALRLWQDGDRTPQRRQAAESLARLEAGRPAP
jgi:tetratricopeptide (TPR) repeat protein